MEKNDRIGYKTDACSVLHSKIIKALNEKAMKRNAIIPYPEVNKVMSWLFHLNRQDRQKLLFELEKLGLIKNYAFHGIRILRLE